MTNTIVITGATKVTVRASTTGGIDELADRQLAPSPKPIVVGSRPCPVAEAAGRAWSEAEIAAEDHLTQAAEAIGLDSVG